MRRDECAVGVGCTAQVLVEKQVAVVGTVGEIVDDHDAGGGIAQKTFLGRGDGVIVDDSEISGSAPLRVGDSGAVSE